MREGSERRPNDVLRAARDALRAVTRELEEYTDECRSRGGDFGFDHDPAEIYVARGVPDEDDEIETRRPPASYPPNPPYPPIPPYPPFPPYPPLPPIIIMCGSGCGHSSWYASGFGHPPAAPWFPAPGGAVNAGLPGPAGQAQAGSTPGVPGFQPPAATSMPAGGWNFAGLVSAVSQQTDSDAASSTT
jgi:hypothetical protein